MRSLATTSAVVLLVTLAAGCRESEGEAAKLHYGRTLDEWFAVAREHVPDESRAPLREPSELPPDARVGLAAFEQALGAPDRWTRQSGAAGIRLFGPHGAAVAPALVRALRDDLRLGRTGPEGVLRIVPEILQKMGESAAFVAPDLLELLRHAEEGAGETRSLVHDLGRIFGSMGTRIAPLLVEALEDEDPRVRSGAVAGLARLGRYGKVGAWKDEALPVLRRVLESEDASTRRGAVGVLYHLGAEAAPALSKLRRMLAEDDEVRERIAMLFPSLCEPQPRAPDPKRASLSETRRLLSDPETCQQGLHDLERLGAAAAPAVPDVVAVLDRGPTFDWEVADTLRAIRSDPDRTVPALARIIRRNESAGRLHGLRAVRNLGPWAKGATPAVIAALEDVSHCTQAADALAAIGEGAGEALSSLRRLLEDRRPEVRRAAANALRVLSGETETTIPVLVDCLRAETWHTRRRAAEDLGAIGKAAAGALPALAAASSDPVGAVRKAAVAAREAID